ncbi:MAG TPA: CsbD family protein [Candidatus Dormibacteraeota bacterium]|jgi:uncharacterized protein YjbJ (UPF0337 family)
MPELKNKLEGHFKKTVGKATGDKKLEKQGRAQETRGKAEEVERKGKERASALRVKARQQASK